MDALEAQLARRIADLRAQRDWTLSELAEHSGVSKSMLSKVERNEASPTASTLLRLAAAFDMTLAELLAVQAGASRFLDKDSQSRWMDPMTGYQRRQVYLSPSLPLELVEVLLPAGKRVAAPAASYAQIRQVVWLLEGSLVIEEDAERTTLEAGDRLEFGPPADVVFHNASEVMARYLVAVMRR